MERCDVIVVGGGPAGSTCAWQLTRAGLDVVVLDRARFPRDKPCAGWITPPVVEALELPLDEYASASVLQRITGFRTGLIGGASCDTRYPEVVSYGILRRQFDAFLLRRSGARVREGEAFSSARRSGGRWIVNETLSAPVLVGAGGHFCPVARLRPPAAAEPVVVAQEVEFELGDPDHCPVDAERPELYFSPDLRGYGWCFRKQHVLNVGLGRQDPRGLTGHLRAFVQWLRREEVLPPDLPERWKGHAYLLAGASRRRVVDTGLVLVGDAAGLAYAASGEGIRPAVESGILAARTIVEASGRATREALEPYRVSLERRFGAPGTGPGLSRVLGERGGARVARVVLGSRWLTRHVFLPRVFLQPGFPPPERVTAVPPDAPPRYSAAT